MTDITIPPEALEAGALAYRAQHISVSHEDAIRAAFLAMLKAWPGMKLTPWWEFTTHKRRVDLILPLPQETPDDKA